MLLPAAGRCDTVEQLGPGRSLGRCPGRCCGLRVCRGLVDMVLLSHQSYDVRTPGIVRAPNWMLRAHVAGGGRTLTKGVHSTDC